MQTYQIRVDGIEAIFVKATISPAGEILKAMFGKCGYVGKRLLKQEVFA